jgi:hypothetical protein
MDLSVTLSRTLLSLADLEINDHENYYIAELGDLSVAWRRVVTSSPYVDGEITTQRSRQNTNRQVTVEVLGTDWGNAQANARALIDALSQDEFEMTITQDTEVTTYLCEASDYVWKQAKERWHSTRGQLTFGLLSKPMPISGLI